MKQTVAWLLAIVAWAFQPAWADEGVPYARDLQKDAALAREKDGVVLVIFARPHCSYCETVLNQFLIPMSRNADYQGKLVMRKVDAGGAMELKDFDGRKLSQQQFAEQHGVSLTPTVMVFNGRGEPLAKPLVGLSTVDYYGYFLDQAIDQGVRLVRGLQAAVTAPGTP
jgi:thioredoxin-related protein